VFPDEDETLLLRAALTAQSGSRFFRDNCSEQLLGRQRLWSLALAENASHKMQEKLQIDPSHSLKKPVLHSISAIKNTAF